MALDIDLAPMDDAAGLALRWRALEQRAQGGFFRSWTFLGCCLERRFIDPFVLSARDDGQDLALALMNRHRGRLHIGETGSAALDAVFTEHGGVLVREGAETVLAPALREALRRAKLTLAGIDAAQLAACRQAGTVHLRQQRFAPAIDLAGLDRPYLDTLSANARAQIRRARRLCGQGLALTRAGSVPEALHFFQVLMGLHQTSWQRRGHAGAFATPAIQDFHRSLIERAWPRGEADLLRIAADGRDIGYLYNFLHGGRVFCYQSGFIAAGSRQEKPGLVCHSLAIETYAVRGMAVYDLLGGASRYKTTLARGGEMLHWVTVYPKASPAGLLRAAASRLRGG